MAAATNNDHSLIKTIKNKGMLIQLKQLSIVNFKGISSLEINFNHITNVYGDNATGKTTIFDAFLWLFFGKNSDDVSQFEIKRLDSKGNFIKNMESEVSAIIKVDQQEISVKKVLRQKWVKRRGELHENYNGDENCYFWNDVPMKEGDFKVKIKAIVDETLFRLITNPFYFNSQKWQDRRNTLIDIAGNITNDEVFDSVITVANRGQFNSLIYALNAGKTVDEFKRELGAKKKKIKDEAESIPSRIDEVRRGMPDELNFPALQTEMEGLKVELSTIQNTLNDEVAMQAAENKRRSELLRTYNQNVQDRQQKIFSIKTKMQNIEFEVKQQAKDSTGKLDAEIRSISSQIADKKYDHKRFSDSLGNLGDQLADSETRVQAFRDQYEEIGNEELKFDDHEFVCPSCKQSLPAGDVDAKKEELTANFNKDKISRLNSKRAEAIAVKAEIDHIKTRIENGKNKVSEIDTELVSLEEKLSQLEVEASQPVQAVSDIVNEKLSAHSEYQGLKRELAETEAITYTEPVFEQIITNADLKERREFINTRLFDIQKELNNEAAIKKANQRILELEQQENKLSQELADLEGTEFAIMEFTKAKVDAIERKINGKFKIVKFKMFTTQVNGGEVECCETMINGVPFSDANNAAKINAGIDIINTLCRHYNVYAPIFIDNRESVTRLIDSDSQIVNLFVSEVDKKLRVA